MYVQGLPGHRFTLRLPKSITVGNCTTFTTHAPELAYSRHVVQSDGISSKKIRTELGAMVPRGKSSGRGVGMGAYQVGDK